MSETATIRRYQGRDETEFGLLAGALVACIEADYDDEKVVILFTLPDLCDPQRSAYLDEIGPELVTIEVEERDEEPWGMLPAPEVDVAEIVAKAEAADAHAQEVLDSLAVREALRTLVHSGLSRERIGAALAALDS